MSVTDALELPTTVDDVRKSKNQEIQLVQTLKNSVALAHLASVEPGPVRKLGGQPWPQLRTWTQSPNDTARETDSNRSFAG